VAVRVRLRAREAVSTRQRIAPHARNTRRVAPGLLLHARDAPCARRARAPSARSVRATRRHAQAKRTWHLFESPKTRSDARAPQLQPPQRAASAHALRAHGQASTQPGCNGVAVERKRGGGVAQCEMRGPPRRGASSAAHVTWRALAWKSVRYNASTRRACMQAPLCACQACLCHSLRCVPFLASSCGSGASHRCT
jgi:hypothetical protein